MYVREVADLFRQFADEQDRTFLTDAQVSQYCRLGYEEFYRIIQKTSPESITTGVNITLSNVDRYDLADAANPVRLLGSSLTHRRLLRLYRIALIDPTTNVIKMILEGVNSAEELQASKQPALNSWFFPIRYFFGGTQLFFTGQIQDTINVSYIPYPNRTDEFATGINWSLIGPADTERIDDFQDFHELIALFAYQRYAIRDGGDNQQLQRQLAALRSEFVSYLTSGRNLDVLHVQQSW
jgi:hypothetical protein